MVCNQADATVSIFDSSSFICCSAYHKSCACCIRSQRPGPFPANLPILSAISVVIGWVQASTRCNCCHTVYSNLFITMVFKSHKTRFNIFYGWYIVAAGTLLLATCFGITYSFSVYFPALQSDFSWNRAATSGVYSLYLVLVGFFSILCGRAIDRYGPKPVVLIMGVVTGISFILTAQVHTLWQFYFSYSVLLAAGTGGMYIIVMSTASRWFSIKRATAMRLRVP